MGGISRCHHGGMPSLPTRHDAVLTRIIDALPRLAPEGALLLVGSGATSGMDELSDLDVILALPKGTFTYAWDARHTLSAHALWRDDAPESLPDGPGVHKWLTREVVLVEVLFGEPGQFRIAPPFALVWGDEALASWLPQRPPIDRVRDMGPEPLAVVRAYDELKDVVRRLRAK